MRNINKSFPVFATIQNVENETSLQLFDYQLIEFSYIREIRN